MIARYCGMRVRTELDARCSMWAIQLRPQEGSLHLQTAPPLEMIRRVSLAYVGSGDTADVPSHARKDIIRSVDYAGRRPRTTTLQYHATGTLQQPTSGRYLPRAHSYTRERGKEKRDSQQLGIVISRWIRMLVQSVLLRWST